MYKMNTISTATSLKWLWRVTLTVMASIVLGAGEVYYTKDILAAIALIFVISIFLVRPIWWFGIWLFLESGLFHLDETSILELGGKPLFLNEAFFIVGMLTAVFYFMYKLKTRKLYRVERQIGVLFFVGAVLIVLYTGFGFIHNDSRLVLQDIRRTMYYFTPFLVVVLMNASGKIHRLLETVLKLSYIIAGIAIIAWLTHASFLIDSGLRGSLFEVRPSGMEFVLFAWLVSLVNVLTTRKTSILQWIGFVVLTGGLLTTLMRTDYIGMLAGLVVLVIWKARLRNTVMFLAFVGSLLIIALSSFSVIRERLFSLTSVNSIAHSGTVAGNSILLRYVQYQQGLMHLEQHILGTGLGTTLPLYAAFSDIGYIWLTMNFGIVGLGWIIIYMFFVVKKVIRNTNNINVAIALLLPVDLVRAFGMPVFFQQGTVIVLFFTTCLLAVNTVKDKEVVFSYQVKELAGQPFVYGTRNV